MSVKTPIVFIYLLLIPAVTWCADQVTVNEVIAHCDRKLGGADQAGTLDFTIANRKGTVTFHRVFHYRWKDYEGSGDVLAKLALLTRDPHDYKGTNYLRWEYTRGSDKTVDQWVYTPGTQKVRRISTRDPRDLTWGIIGEDLQIRQWQEDNLRLVQEEQDGDRQIYHIESTPTGTDSFYSKVITRFVKDGAWDTCVPWTTDFYDKDGQKIKSLVTDWSKMGEVRVRNSVTVTRDESGAQYRYVFSEIHTNNDFSDNEFTVRYLPRPYVEPPRR